MPSFFPLLKKRICLIITVFMIGVIGCDLSSNKNEPDIDPPSAPQGLNILPSPSYPLTLNWTAADDNFDVAGYRIFRDGEEIGITGTTYYPDSTVEAGVNYSYTVSAYDAAGNESAPSDPATGTAANLPSPENRLINHLTRDAESIPDEWITAAQNSLFIAYNHTSHGSQIISGMDALANYDPYVAKYLWQNGEGDGLCLFDGGIPGTPDLSQGDSVDENGDTPWVVDTRAFLDDPANDTINVIMWSWCSISGHDIDLYLANMEKLIAEYGEGGYNTRATEQPVEFVFMTGHTEGGSQDEYDSPWAAATKIRDHCVAHNRWLVDYYDMECYDPVGPTDYGTLNVSDNLDYNSGANNWAVEYLAAHSGSDLAGLTDECAYCAHSDADAGHAESKLNCVLKAQAAWWLFARLSGWDGEI